MLCNAALWYEAAERLVGSEVKEGRGPKALQRAFEPTTSDHVELDEKRGSHNSQVASVKQIVCPPLASRKAALLQEPVWGCIAVFWEEEEEEEEARRSCTPQPCRTAICFQGDSYCRALQGAEHRGQVRPLLTFLFPVSFQDLPCSRELKQLSRVGPVGQTWNPLQAVEAE